MIARIEKSGWVPGVPGVPGILSVLAALCAVGSLASACDGRSVGRAGPDSGAPSECEVRFETETLGATAQGWESVQIDVTGGGVVYTTTDDAGLETLATGYCFSISAHRDEAA